MESLCPSCHQRRQVLLGELESSQVVKYEDWKWRVRYDRSEPHDRLDFLAFDGGEEGEETEAEEMERQGVLKRLSWKRKSKSDACQSPTSLVATSIGSPATPKSPRRGWFANTAEEALLRLKG